MKKIDRLVIRSFLPPFVVTFFIALFVFVMQTLWLYIDNIAGKGVGFFLLVELVSYMSVSMIPMALPVAVLISSVMVMGNMAESYELSSIKSAGISLWRTMAPLMMVTAIIGVLSFFCSNYFLPVSNLKFKSRLHDIKNQKPALSLEESVFNEDFKGYSIRIGDKMPDNQTIKDVLLFDDTQTNKGRMSLVTADSGSMYGSKDGNYFVMQLYHGTQLSEPKPTSKSGKRNYPMMRVNYEEWTKIFDLDQFELDRTDEGLFKSHHTMLSNRQLLVAIDSIDKNLEERIERFSAQTTRHFHFQEQAMQKRLKEERLREAERKKAEAEKEKEKAAQEESKQKKSVEQSEKTDSKPKPPSPKKPEPKPKKKKETTIAKAKPKSAVKKPSAPPPNKPKAQNAKPKQRGQQPKKREPWPQTIDSSLSSYPSILMTFGKENGREAVNKAAGTARTIRDQSKSTSNSIRKTRESRVKHVYEYNTKFSLAVACFIFLFIGAPMGAIVRKGGFGWPLLISIIFFMLFVIIGIFSKNIAERFVIDAVLASWMACLIIFPMGLVLTYWAMRDMGWTQIVEFFSIKLPGRSRSLSEEEPES